MVTAYKSPVENANELIRCVKKKTIRLRWMLILYVPKSKQMIIFSGCGRYLCLFTWK
jgi:hypothetical protein